MRKIVALMAVAVLSMPACGGGSGTSPTAPPATIPPPRDGVVVINGSVGGRFVFSSTPNRHRDGTSFGCGDAEVTIPYRETNGGAAVGADFELKILDLEGFSRRSTGMATNIAINPRDSGTITFTERFVCVDFSDALPPRGEVAINFGGRATGLVSQISGIGPLVLVQ